MILFNVVASFPPFISVSGSWHETPWSRQLQCLNINTDALQFMTHEQNHDSSRRFYDVLPIKHCLFLRSFPIKKKKKERKYYTNDYSFAIISRFSRSFKKIFLGKNLFFAWCTYNNRITFFITYNMIIHNYL